METLEAINKRKSVRAYKDEQITEDELDTIVGVIRLQMQVRFKLV